MVFVILYVGLHNIDTLICLNEFIDLSYRDSVQLTLSFGKHGEMLLQSTSTDAPAS